MCKQSVTVHLLAYNNTTNTTNTTNKANKMTKTNGYILYKGPSKLDGASIVVIATGFAKQSDNTKTGDMIQTWILRDDIKPHEAQKTGEDASVCGQCPMRPLILARAKKNGERLNDKPCYVKTFQAPRSVQDAYQRGIYSNITDYSVFNNRVLRVGSYGDPAAVPSKVWAKALENSKSNTGYTHQWERFSAPRSFVMASVESPELRDKAKAKGFRTFRTKHAGDPLLPGEIACPASKEAGQKTQCASCRLCGGASVKGKDIAINIH